MEDVAKTVEKKEPELTASHGHTEIALFTEQLSGNDLKTSKKDFLQSLYKDIKKEPQKDE